MTKFESISYTGNSAIDPDKATRNEDAVLVCKDFGVVVDGASGIFKERVTAADSDAQWFALTWKDYLQSALIDKTKSIKDIVKTGITQIDRIYMSLPNADKIKSKPSASIAIFRIENEQIQYFMLGDSPMMFVLKDGNFEYFIPGDCIKLDAEVIASMVSISKQEGIDVFQARPLVQDMIVHNRLRLQNQAGGYWILSDSVQAADNALMGSIPLENVTHIVAMSDGFSQIFDVLNIYSKQEFATKVASGVDLQKFYDEIKTAQTNDNHCNKFPRYKQSDDTSAILVEL